MFSSIPCKSDQRIQQQQPRPEPLGRLEELLAMPLLIEAERGGRDHVDLDLLQLQAAMPGHALDALPHDRQGVLGQVDQDRPRLRDAVAAQAGRAGGDTQGQVQAQPRFGALGRSADQADGGSPPQRLNQPALRAVLAGDLRHADDGQRGFGWLRHLQTLAFFLPVGRGPAG